VCPAVSFAPLNVLLCALKPHSLCACRLDHLICADVLALASAGTAIVLSAQVLAMLATAGRMMHGTFCTCLYTLLTNSLHDS